MVDTPSWSERRRQFRQEKGLPLDDEQVPAPKSLIQKAQSQVEVDPDLIPDVYERSETDEAIDRTLDSINVLQAYQEWCGKAIDPATLGRREGVMVSCPIPGHEDRNPSAWINMDKGTWFCGKCQQGGDKYDIAAYGKGYPVPGYKQGSDFHKLREDMAADFGTHVRRTPGTHEELVWHEEDSLGDKVNPPPATEEEIDEHPVSQLADAVIEVREKQSADNDAKQATQASEAKQAPESSDQGAEAGSTSGATPLPVMHEDEEWEDEGDLTIYPTLPIDLLIKPDTFLYDYVKACSVDDSPVEYHFWNGMLGLGHAAGRNVRLKDNPDVLGNLLMVILGKTGTGKSKSRRYLETIIREVMPFDKSAGFFTTGVKMVSAPGSGEALIDSFVHVAEDPSALSNPKAKALAPVFTPVNGMLNVDELSQLMKTSGRSGNNLESIIQGMADGKTEVSTSSRGHGDVYAYMPFCSITTSSQPMNLAGLLMKEHLTSGFLNRWIFVTGEAKKRQVFSNNDVDLARATDQLKAVRAFCGTERRLPIDPEVLPDFIEWFETVIHPKQEKDSTQLLARLDLIMKRMFLLLSINAKEVAISRDTFERGKLLLPYFIKSYALVHEKVGIGKAFEIAENVLAMIKHFESTKGAPPSMRDINKALWRKKYSPEQINKTIAELIKAERLEEIKPAAGTRGRPAVKYKAVA